MKPYYQDDLVTIYHGDSREIVKDIPWVDTVVTDPTWPNAKAEIFGKDDPAGMLRSVLEALPSAERLALQFGCDSDPRILSAVPMKWPFLRSVGLNTLVPLEKAESYTRGTWPISSGSQLSTVQDVG